MNNNLKEILKMGAFLAAVAAIAAGILAATYTVTAPLIEENKVLEINQALKQIIVGADSFKKQDGYYIAKQKGREIAKVYSVAPVGYSGPIEMLVGVNDDGEVAGVKIIKITETPGLGLNATDPKFLSQFKNKTSKAPLEPKKDIDAITGATITTKAVCDGVREALGKFKRH